VEKRIFTEEEDTSVEPVTPLPVKRATLPERNQTTDAQIARYRDLLPYGTDIGDSWSEIWVTQVAEVEKTAGYAICGSRLRETEVDQMVESEKMTQEEADTNPLSVVCRFKAGLETSHPGSGRCYRHGGSTDPGDMFSLLKHSTLSPRVREFFESEDLLDLRGAIATVWASADALIGTDGEVGMAYANDLAALMTRVGNLTKQHNDIMEKREITIEVPEFISWAEHLYELAIRYIQDGEKDVQGFLQEAQSYYNATVTLTVGLTPTGDSNSKERPFSSDSASEVLRPSQSES